MTKSTNSFLDSQNYHVFEYEGKVYLFSLYSDALSEISPDMAKAIKVASSRSIDCIQGALEEEFGKTEGKEAFQAIQELNNANFFSPPEYWGRDSDGFKVLMNHRPRRIQLLVSQACNLKCVYCYEEANGSNARKRLMSFDQAKMAVDHLVRASGKRKDLQVTFFGGEPLLNYSVIREVVAYCHGLQANSRKRFTFELITNGTLLSRDKIHWLADNDFLLMISLDGHREMNRQQRPANDGKDYHQVICQNAKLAHQIYRSKGRRQPIKVRANLTETHSDYTGVVRYLEGEGFPTIGVAPILPLPWDDSNGHACSPETLEDINSQQDELIDGAIEKVLKGQKPSPFEAKLLRIITQERTQNRSLRGLFCGVGRNTNIVDVDGEIYPCHRYGNLKEYSLGNTATGLDPNKLANYYQKVNVANCSSECKACWARTLCSGDCAWALSDPNGKVLSPDKADCDRKRQGFEKGLARESILQASGLVKGSSKELRPQIDSARAIEV